VSADDRTVEKVAEAMYEEVAAGGSLPWEKSLLQDGWRACARAALAALEGELIAVWPCDHGGVMVEPGRAKPGYQCSVCGETARTALLLPSSLDRTG
jgi:hypothetical protein